MPFLFFLAVYIFADSNAYKDTTVLFIPFSDQVSFFLVRFFCFCFCLTSLCIRKLCKCLIFNPSYSITSQLWRQHNFFHTHEFFLSASKTFDFFISNYFRFVFKLLKKTKFFDKKTSQRKVTKTFVRHYFLIGISLLLWTYKN